MPKAMVPIPTTTSRRTAWSPSQKVAQDSRKLGSAAGGARPRAGRRVSCFHMAATFRSIAATAAAWITCTSRPGEKSAKAAPNNKALAIMPTSSMTYIRPTTLAWDAGGVRSVARASPAVCTMWAPAPTIRKAIAAETWPIQSGASAASSLPASTRSAKGMTAKPPNWSSDPCQMKGTRRQPSSQRWVSDRNPIRARKGANTSGRATMRPTSDAGTPSSTIMTRLSVPTSSTRVMPTETWNRESRSRRRSGRSGVATSANGRKRGPNAIHAVISLCPSWFMPASCLDDSKGVRDQPIPNRRSP